MNITIRLTRVEYKMPKELQKRNRRHKKELKGKIQDDIKQFRDALIAMNAHIVILCSDSREGSDADTSPIKEYSNISEGALGVSGEGNFSSLKDEVLFSGEYLIELVPYSCW